MVVDGKFLRSVVSYPEPSRQVYLQMPTPWHNPVNGSDINNSGSTTVLDALQIINELGRRRFFEPATNVLYSPIDMPIWPDVYLDQNNDGKLTAIDALRVINQMKRESDSDVGEGESVDFIMGRWESAQTTELTERWDQQSSRLTDSPEKRLTGFEYGRSTYDSNCFHHSRIRSRSQTLLRDQEESLNHDEVLSSEWAEWLTAM